MDAQELVNLLRRQRHDFANHLQVVGGYLELERPDKALQYLKQVTEELALERTFFKSGPYLAVLLYGLQLEVREKGVRMLLEDAVLTPDDEMILFKAKEAVVGMLNEVLQSRENDLPLTLRWDFYSSAQGITATIKVRVNGDERVKQVLIER